MKNKTQREALISLFKKGKTLNWVKAFKLTGCSKLSTRVSEFTQAPFKMKFKKVKVVFKTAYNTTGYYYNYSLIK